MAIRHSLSIEIPQVVNPYVLSIWDNSVYSINLPVTCARLDVLLPGFTQPVYVSTTSGFRVNLDAHNLGLVLPDSDDKIMLPDGVYNVAYSVSPNDIMKVEYYHMRTTRIMHDYYILLGKQVFNECDDTKNEKLSELHQIRMFIETAKAKAEVLHAPGEAVEMLAYAQRLLSKFRNSSCCK